MIVDIVVEMHFVNMILVLAAGTITFIWGFILFFMKKQTIIRPWRISLIITAVVSLLQGVLGIILLLLGQRPGPPGDSLYYLHFVYGGIVALAIPVAVTYATGGKQPRRDILIYSLVTLVLVAAAVRALMTGPS
jgi:heme A synthase